MNVPSYEFLGFAAVVALVGHIFTSILWRRVVLLVANTAFFLSFTHDPKQLAPFASFLALGYLSVKLLESHKRTSAFCMLTGAIVLSFCWLKQYTFIPHGIFLPFAYMTVGMSYVFFRIVHLVVDAFQGTLPCRIDILSYINYTLNFTCLVSGPIQLYPDYRRTESEAPLPLDERAVGSALERIIVGFFKVTTVSPLLSHAQNRCIDVLSASLPIAERILDAGLIVAIFPLFLYVNFSGYTDFVIGVARFLSLEVPENFNNPFSAKGFIDFWGRWHMTLSAWFKTYVYSPLLITLMRRFPDPAVEPILGICVYFVTFFFVGVWHGQTTMFLFYGLLQGLGVSLNKLYQIAMTRRMGRARYRELCANCFYSSLSRGLTFTWFAFTLLWFWSTWDQLAHFTALLGPTASAAAILLVIGIATLLLGALETVREHFSMGTRIYAFITSSTMRTAWCATLLGITLSVTLVLNAPAPHIVYKAF